MFSNHHPRQPLYSECMTLSYISASQITQKLCPSPSSAFYSFSSFISFSQSSSVTSSFLPTPFERYDWSLSSICLRHCLLSRWVLVIRSVHDDANQMPLLSSAVQRSEVIDLTAETGLFSPSPLPTLRNLSRDTLNNLPPQR